MRLEEHNHRIITTTRESWHGFFVVDSCFTICHVSILINHVLGGSKMKGCRPLSDEEIQKVLNKMSTSRKNGRYAKRNLLLFVFGLKTGYRISELLSIKVCDIMHPDGKIKDYVMIHKRYVKQKTSGRSCIIHPDIKKRVKGVVESMNLTQDDYLFCSQRTRSRMTRESCHRMFKRAFDLLQLDGQLGTHCMRKTFAKNVYRRTGYDLMATRDALGHTDVWTTVKYLQADRDTINNAILSND